MKPFKLPTSFSFRSSDRATIFICLAAGFSGILFWGASNNDFTTPERREKEYRFQVDLNSASSVELQTLPGIGEKLAEGIISYREEDLFQSVEEIRNIRGIGPKKTEAIKPFLLEIRDE